MIFSGKYDFIINGCDAGREGQAIFWSFYESTGANCQSKDCGHLIIQSKHLEKHFKIFWIAAPKNIL